MNCNFCGKEISLKEVWAKEKSYKKIFYIALYWFHPNNMPDMVITLSGRKNKKNILIRSIEEGAANGFLVVILILLICIGYISIIFCFGGVFVTYLLNIKFDLQRTIYFISLFILGAVSLSIYAAILYFLVFKKDLEGSFESLMSQGFMSIKCPSCGGKNKTIGKIIHNTNSKN